MRVIHERLQFHAIAIVSGLNGNAKQMGMLERSNRVDRREISLFETLQQELNSLVFSVVQFIWFNFQFTWHAIIGKCLYVQFLT